MQGGTTKQNPIGIDISDFSIEIVQLDTDKKISAYGRAVLERGVVKNGIVLEQEKLASAVNGILKDTAPNRLSETGLPLQAIVSLPESKVFTHIIPVAQGTENIYEYVENRASKIIPADIKSMYWDCVLIKGDEMNEAFFIGVKKDIVDGYIGALLLSDTEPIAFDGELISAARSILPESGTEESTLIVDIGARATHIGIYDRDTIITSAIEVPIGGEDITDKLTETLNIKREEANNLKDQHGFIKNSNTKVHMVLETVLLRIIEDVKNAISYHEEKTGDQVSKIILTGGASLIPGIVHYFKKVLDREVILGEPFQHITDGDILKKSGMQPVLFATVIGLALRGAGHASFTMNVDLLQKHTKDQKGSLQVSISPNMRKLRTSLRHINIKQIGAIIFVSVAVLILGFVLFRFLI